MLSDEHEPMGDPTFGALSSLLDIATLVYKRIQQVELNEKEFEDLKGRVAFSRKLIKDSLAELSVKKALNGLAMTSHDHAEKVRNNLSKYISARTKQGGYKKLARRYACCSIARLFTHRLQFAL